MGDSEWIPGLLGHNKALTVSMTAATEMHFRETSIDPNAESAQRDRK